MTEALLEAADVVKQLGSGAGAVQALKGVNLLLTGGQMTLLMGPSGSGKTTLLCILGCMLTPTSGTVRVRGHSTAGAGPEELAKLRRDHVGFVFQSYHLFPDADRDRQCAAGAGRPRRAFVEGCGESEECAGPCRPCPQVQGVSP